MVKLLVSIIFVTMIFLSACAETEDVLRIDEHAATEHEELVIEKADEPMISDFVEYGDGFSGYLVKPTKSGDYPGVIMIHEWWGLNQNIKNMAHDLSEEGFIVLAVDLFDGKVADNPTDARIYSGQVNDNMDKAMLHLKSGIEFLKEEQNVMEIASIGWCFGGGMSMQLSLQEELDATVIYYGAVETDPEQLKKIDWPVLGIFGEVDSVIPLDSVLEFNEVLDDIGIVNEIYVYEELGHAFANPSNAGHDPKSTKDAWKKTVDFLNTNLK